MKTDSFLARKLNDETPKKKSDTESVDIAELAMSDLEDESDAIFERFS